MSANPSLLAELKQRHVVRAAIIYAAAVWALAQGISQLSPAFGLSTGVTFWFVIACVIGFPFWIAFAWFFKFTSSGIVREDETVEDPATIHRTGRILDYWIIGIMAVAIVLLLTNEVVLQRGEALREFAAAPTPAAKSAVKVPVAATSSRIASVTSQIAAQPIPAKSVAVLPFENLSTDQGNAYFADGIQDLILTKLADIGGLKVISRTSTQSYGSHPENLTLVGKQLGVATILEGSVQKARNQVLINVQLIDAKTDAHIWAQSYQRNLTNIFGVEGEVAQKVATALSAKLTYTEKREIARLPTTNPEAYTLYLKAVHEINQFFGGDNKAEDVKFAVSYLQQAVDKDPQFALAYALLARAQGDLQFNDIENSAALAGSELANAREAVALQPNLAEAHDYLAVAYGANAMFGKVIPELEIALRLDPTNLQTRFHLAMELRARGNWDQAEAVMAPVLQMNPTDPLAYMRVAEMDMNLRRYHAAQTTLAQGFAISPDSQGLVADQVFLLLLWGKPSLALQWSARLKTKDGTRQQLDFYAYMQLRQFAQALSVAKAIPESKDGLATAGKALMFADAARHMGNQTLANGALINARNAIEPYLQGPGTRTVMALSHREQAFGMLADIEKLSGHRDAAMIAARKPLLISPSPVFAASAQTHFLERSAKIAAYFGDAKEAVDALQRVLATQGTGQDVSTGTLRRDPIWDPIRNNPAFLALLKKYAEDNPAATHGNPSPAGGSSTTTH